jgi:hypothetical protein
MSLAAALVSSATQAAPDVFTVGDGHRGDAGIVGTIQVNRYGELTSDAPAGSVHLLADQGVASAGDLVAVWATDRASALSLRADGGLVGLAGSTAGPAPLR